jgi:hypothetical protein
LDIDFDDFRAEEPTVDLSRVFGLKQGGDDSIHLNRGVLEYCRRKVGESKSWVGKQQQHVEVPLRVRLWVRWPAPHS